MSNETKKNGYGWFFVALVISLIAFYGQQPVIGAIAMFIAGFNAFTRT